MATKPVHREILTRRLDYHLAMMGDRAVGKASRLIHRRLAKRLRIRIIKLDMPRPKKQDNGDACECPIAGIGLKTKTSMVLESAGILLAGELRGWSRARLLAIPGMGPLMLAEIVRKIAPLGISLREPIEREKFGNIRVVKISGAEPTLSAVEMSIRKRTIILAMVNGASEREANRRAGLAENTRWMPTEIKRRIRRFHIDGLAPREIAGQLGFSQSELLMDAITSWIERVCSGSPKGAIRLRATAASGES